MREHSSSSLQGILAMDYRKVEKQSDIVISFCTS